ncbi:MAG TPA: Spy/CpxP family protein refolding chaperone [Gemmatimonadales bacterium]|nr:Spy/CpxP family protein refolding chaperone [Gemmatimonadales bacterium]
MQIRYLLGLAALVAALPASAQRPDSTMRVKMMMRDSGMRHGRPGMMAGRMGMGPGRMGMMTPGGRFAPERLLAMNGELKLTARQMTDLTTIRDASRSAAEAAMAGAKTHLGELRTAIDADGTDTVAIKKHFQAAHDLMGQAMLERILAGARARALLTDAQRKQVEAWPPMGMMGGRGWQGGSWQGRRGPGMGPKGPGSWPRTPPPAGAPKGQ